MHDCRDYRVKRPWRCDCGARLRVCTLCRADLSKHKGKCARLYPIWPDWRPPDATWARRRPLRHT